MIYSVQNIAGSQRVFYDKRNARSSCALVAALFRCGRPSDVAGGIPAVVVNAVNAVPRRRAQANCGDEIGKESFETSPPAFADLDTASAIMLEALVPRIVTTLEHRPPTDIFSGWSFVLMVGCMSMGGAVLFCCHRGPLSLQATATLGLAISEIGASDDCLVMAFALDLPRGSTMLVHVRKPNDQQPAEMQTAHIQESSHWTYLRGGLGPPWPFAEARRSAQ